MMKVVKKNNKFVEDFQEEKIIRAINLSASRVNVKIEKRKMDKILLHIKQNMKNMSLVTVEEIHSFVIDALRLFEPTVYEQYNAYVDYKHRFNKCFAEIASSSKRIIYNGDKENANKNSSLISTKKELLSGLVSKELMLEFELADKIVKAYKEGWIYLHDLSDLFVGSYNCGIIDVANILNGGFELNGIFIEEPKTIESACNIICDIILCGSSQQYGGYSIESLDTILAKYVRKSYKKETKFYKELGLTGKKLLKVVDDVVNEKLNQGIQTIEYKINCVNNACG